MCLAADIFSWSIPTCCGYHHSCLRGRIKSRKSLMLNVTVSAGEEEYPSFASPAIPQLCALHRESVFPELHSSRIVSNTPHNASCKFLTELFFQPQVQRLC